MASAMQMLLKDIFALVMLMMVLLLLLMIQTCEITPRDMGHGMAKKAAKNPQHQIAALRLNIKCQTSRKPGYGRRREGWM
eukprot:1284788-Karenia_brevis.AAC.1